mgnify:FL=1|jgi:hypothetical protein
MIKDKEQGFLVNGVLITNPTLDETGRFTVDPFTYYGKDFDAYSIGGWSLPKGLEKKS